MNFITHRNFYFWAIALLTATTIGACQIPSPPTSAASNQVQADNAQTSNLTDTAAIINTAMGKSSNQANRQTALQQPQATKSIVKTKQQAPPPTTNPEPKQYNNTTAAAVQNNNERLTNSNYAWFNNYNPAQSLMQRVEVPNGYERENYSSNSFGYWLQRLPLKAGKPPVKLYNGQDKGNQSAHEAVVEIDVGNKDLQQCADAVMRLRAEYLWATQQHEAIHFRFTSGQDAYYSKWKQGYRPVVSGNNVSWQKTASPDNSYVSFKKYLQQIFNYCGTHSLSKELKPLASIAQIEAGDVFIKGGFPGHAVIVLDVAKNPNTGKKVFLLAQSYMPAQEIHLLRNPNNAAISPWYETNFDTKLLTPEWTFEKNQLKRF